MITFIIVGIHILPFDMMPQSTKMNVITVSSYDMITSAVGRSDLLLLSFRPLYD